MPYLVGPNLVVKIADFGLARGVHDKDYYRVAGKQLLPVRSMSPESLLFGVFSTAGDVWYRNTCSVLTGYTNFRRMLALKIYVPVFSV